MKIQLMSDLHLEFDPEFRPVNAGADILVLSGDICVADHFTRSEASPYYARAENFKDFFKHCNDEFNRVIYIFGNHEYYRGYVETTADILRDSVGLYATILDNEYVDIGKWRIIGTTLWTNLNGRCPLTENHLRYYMNDYRGQIQWKKDYMKLTPVNTANFHDKALTFIEESTNGHDNVIVCSHHAPSERSVHVMYSNETYMNGGYFSNLDGFIGLKPQIKLWTHGHTHHSFDYNINETRVVCNPKGYNDENKLFNPSKIIEVN